MLSFDLNSTPSPALLHSWIAGLANPYLTEQLHTCHFIQQGHWITVVLILRLDEEFLALAIHPNVCCRASNNSKEERLEHIFSIKCIFAWLCIATRVT